MEHYIKGQFRRSIFTTEAGYCVGIMKVKETDDDKMVDYVGRAITFTGYFHDLNTEDTYLFYGNLVFHERYGDQFQVTRYERVLPEEKDGIVSFLSSGLFRGIGEKKAEKIVSVLGKDTLQIILEQPDNLLLIPTITKKQADILHQTLLEYQESYATIIDLNELGFSTKDSMLIYKKYGAKTKWILENNIYQLYEDIDEVTFAKIDAIALKEKGINPEDPRRLMSGILYAMNEVCMLYGHSYLEYNEIKAYTTRALHIAIDDTTLQKALQQLKLDLKIVIIDDHYYLVMLYEAERKVSERLRFLSRQEDNQVPKLSHWMDLLSQKNEIVYNADQLTAISSSFLKNILIITGGPGTGKTTIIKAICDLYRDIYHLSYQDLIKQLALLAPTGRAAKRLTESTGLQAMTIHRFLKWNKDTNRFAVNAYHKSDATFVIVDEVSMVDILLMDHLFEGLSASTRMIFVGDENQLPSVGPGQVLKDMIESGIIPIARLQQLYRQKENSNIITLADYINHDIWDTSIFNVSPDLSFLPSASSYLRKQLQELAQTYKAKKKEFQVLAPMYKTINGIDQLNIDLQAIFNPPHKEKKELIVSGVTYREEDKVIQLTNMPEENIFNGDIGIIAEIENGNKKSITIDFDGNEVTYTPANFYKFKHAYAISIHKSQGSEFNTVVIPIVFNFRKMLYRKLIYTGITRAKKELYLLGDIDAFQYAIQNKDTDQRRTSLKEMLQK